ncbi:MAG: rhomboid family intramembrane serine protease [Desulfofustis sp.]|nr:rhomboid family intramembrane serine protease [Desulfofustis sp.]
MDQSVEPTADETVVITATDQSLIETCSLVLSATAIEHRTRQQPNGLIALVVDKTAADRAARQLERYFQENRDWPTPARAPVSPLTSSVTPPSILLSGALAIFYLVTGPWRADSPWFAGGAGDASAIIYHGQWYRLLTALTLHADFAHLAGNCLVGGFLLHFFLQIHGTGVGLLAVVLSAMLGNYLNVQLHGGSHVFVGFSTAVFSMIGMLAAHQMLAHRTLFSVRMLVPALAGAALLAMLGSSGERTDLGGHLFGLLAGLGCGLLLGSKPLRAGRHSPFIQACCLLATAALVTISWNRALAPAVY